MNTNSVRKDNSVNTNSVRNVGKTSSVNTNSVRNDNSVNTNSVRDDDNNSSVNTNSVCSDKSVNTNSVRSAKVHKENNVVVSSNDVDVNSSSDNAGDLTPGSCESILPPSEPPDAFMVEVSGSRKRSSVVDYSSSEGDSEIPKKSKQTVSCPLSPRSLDSLRTFALSSGSQ